MIPSAYLSICSARSCFPAPIFWAASADTVASMEDGTMNIKLIIFSTTPTAAASFTPRLLAMTVITMKAICMHPSCTATGRPIFTISPSTDFLGTKSFFAILSPVFILLIATNDIITLNVCARVVPRAAPRGPMPQAPINM